MYQHSRDQYPNDDIDSGQRASQPNRVTGSQGHGSPGGPSSLVQGQNDEVMMELLYDDVLRCYYNSMTGKYYQLV